ncbi:hypothetical protein MPTK1_5g18190 [Marchantia polymorpha subsp. ruderalis]|uniref:Peptidase A1 domain-containing protein n=2 Tax=Marchantia polymorpha TaxID=3197 RepID=A0AAF6BJN1_MARPO|nr:hypothetical protein MARPO_0084s0066 [Marchantia polymorpha]BBN12215.1 hypothetical protein Mp_5g18190 [Marchantia polymorpha subsp. ruderalis]|eukprot:PTQ34002.1 hypothetical protein MARPO_0084s0066 [Marchantia polymorpha]
MQSIQVLRLAVVLLVCSSFVIRCSEAAYTLSFTHMLSEKAKEDHNAQEKGAWPFPDPDTVEYQHLLRQYDAVRHRRMLAGTPSTYTFVEGNVSISFIGGFYYSTISVGTPAVPFLVALDTGSDLFWLPCECQSCAPATAPIYEDYGVSKALKVYSPKASNTSTAISCGSSDCPAIISQCQAAAGEQCLYEQNYAAVNTSTSGRLVQDVLHLIPDMGAPTATQVPVIVGCGQTQTGILVDGFGPPDGLIGLGLENYSVPTTLARSGLVKDSFSMCFGADFAGRVVFGDIGSTAQQSTPFAPAQPGAYNTYYVGVETIIVGGDTITVGMSAWFDTGTQFSYLESATYKLFVASFDKQIAGYTRTTEPQLFEYCYLTRDDIVNAPTIDYVLSGNATFPIGYPLISLFFQNGTRGGFCLAIIESNINLIGVNFMVGMNLVFNREQRTLGFEETDCLSLMSNSGPAPAPNAGGPSPSPGPKASASSPTTRPPNSSTTTPGPAAAPAPSQASHAAAFSLATLLLLGLVHVLL